MCEGWRRKTGLYSGQGDTCPTSVIQRTVHTSQDRDNPRARTFKRKRAMGEDTSRGGEEVYSGPEGQMTRGEEGRALSAEGMAQAED